MKNGYLKTTILDYSAQLDAWKSWGDPNIACCDPITLHSFSLIFWIKASSSPNSVGSLIQVVGDKTSKIWGPVQLGTAMGYNGDTLSLETRLTGATSDGTIVEDYNNPDPRNKSSVYFPGSGSWNHIVYTYNDTTRAVSLFSNGVLISGRILQNFEKPFNFSNENIYLLLGSPAFKETGFAHSDSAINHPLNAMGITASIDELALLFDALPAKDILTLYHLGKAGR